MDSLELKIKQVLESVVTTVVRRELQNFNQQPVAQKEKDVYIKKKEAAALLGVSVQSLNSYIKRGLIPCYRTPGGALQRLKRKDVEASLKQIDFIKYSRV